MVYLEKVLKIYLNLGGLCQSDHWIITLTIVVSDFSTLKSYLKTANFVPLFPYPAI